MKKILSLILAGLMSISCAAFVAADDAAAEATADPYQDYAIEFLANYGIFKGGEGLTNEDLIQRYQMALFVARISTGWVDDSQWEDGTANNSTFDDINDAPANLYLGALSYANQNGIIEGYSATKFAPYDTITYRDALTMVVRTLGYKGLSYPWGYIQTAVELGLTEGIDAAYTDELTRGEVAVIIYNAMFAATKSGETLGKSIFDVDFGWKNIVLVATDEGAVANYKKTTAGLVAFKIINDDMTLSANTYLVRASDLGLAGHAEELELGAIYAALFEVDGDLVKIIDADSLNFATVVNNGITDNEGAAYAKLPILTALEPYALVSKTGAGSYLNWTGTELFVYAQGDYTWTVENSKLVGINYNTADIMWWNGTEWVTAWYYNETLDRYYQYEFDDLNNQIYLNWMSDAEFAEWYAKAITEYKTVKNQYVLKTNFSGFGTNPYAELRLYDTDADGLAEIATYKDYAIGIFANGSRTCGVNANGVNHAGVAMPTYTISKLDGGVVVDQFVEAGHEAHDTGDAQFAWMNVADDVIGFANADGSYNNGVVLYNFNDVTGELEIVKYIPENAEGTDADSYIFTGILQAYSTKGATITVDGEKYAYGYDSLVGNTLVKGNLSIAARSVVAAELDEYLMQYVKVLVVDGLVVDVDLLNASAEIIVVLDYAGITSDGYIAVYAYSTADGALKLYKINSYNGWKQGDYRYNPQNAKADGAFDMGCVYEIKSYDPSTNSYGVYTHTIADMRDEVAASSTITMDSGYRVIDGAYAGTEKAAASDCYIFITSNGIPYVVTGVAANGWTATGDIMYKAGGKIVMFTDRADMLGFDANAHEVGFVMYDKANARVLEAAYDEAQGVEDFYLLGSTVSEVCVFNLMTGKFEYVVTSTNIDLEDGAIYMTIGNVVVRLYAADYDDFKAIAVDNDNIFTHVYAETYDLEKALTKMDVAKLFGQLPNTTNEIILNNAANAFVDEILYYQIVDGSVKSIAITEGYEYDAFLIYNTATKDVVVYVEYFDKIGE